MKSILMSIKPRYVADILNLRKTIEIRKRFPLNYRGWVYIYCTKDETPLVFENDYPLELAEKLCNSRGKVVARFYCDSVETFYVIDKGLCKLSCLLPHEINNYLQGKEGYAIYIWQLEIFDKPKELSEFYKIGHYEDFNDYFTDEKRINGKWCIPLTKAPQSMMYIEVEE